VQRPGARRLARRRREVGEVQRAVAREVRVEQQVVQARARRSSSRPARRQSAPTRQPFGCTTRIVPPFCVIRKLPSGRNATAHAPVSPVADRLDVEGRRRAAGGGASVWPGKAGVGSGDCATSEIVNTASSTAATRVVIVMARGW
jgi:hypothetical protein